MAQNKKRPAATETDYAGMIFPFGPAISLADFAPILRNRKQGAPPNSQTFPGGNRYGKNDSQLLNSPTDSVAGQKKWMGGEN
jgi:hypothetical protein